MKPKEIILERPGHIHCGYQLLSISKSKFEIKDLSVFRRLKRVPGKVTAFLDRAKIKEVFKSDCFKDPADDYYLVRANDDTIFHLEY